MAKKKITIHKKNEFVRGSDIYSLDAKRAMNAIYYGVQKNQFYKHDMIRIRFSTLREWMSLENDNRYIERIKEALLELEQPLQLNNYYHPIMQETYAWYSMSFLNEAGIKQVEDGTWIADVQVGNLTRHLMQIKENFTELDLVQYMNKFRTKYAMKLYEYLKSFEGYQYLDVTQDHLMKLLALGEKSKYKYYSQLYELVERQIKDIAKKSDLKELHIKPLKADKTIRFMLNKKAPIKTADTKKLEQALEAVIKRF